ncbi:hypothetical protein BD770DRAFT_416454 [Pilaira anomala]|nr:hypothetical protein BD770DRAFT_416454 [Pilaira anomala]
MSNNTDNTQNTTKKQKTEHTDETTELLKQIKQEYQQIYEKSCEKHGKSIANKTLNEWFNKLCQDQDMIESQTQKRNQRFQKDYTIPDFSFRYEQITKAKMEIPHYLPTDNNTDNFVQLTNISEQKFNLRAALTPVSFTSYILCHRLYQKLENKTENKKIIMEKLNWKTKKFTEYLKRCSRINELSEITGDAGAAMFSFHIPGSDFEKVKEDEFNKFLTNIKSNKQLISYLQKLRIDSIYIDTK